ncbi:MAG: peptide-methionine (S)-S-oxide reductase [Flavobacteriaceae bacterium]
MKKETGRKLDKVALGGGCHWCTEAVFQSLKGVQKVEQGFVASHGPNTHFSEAVIVHFDAQQISLATLMEIHLYTHQSTSDHSMRAKYRSAVYTYSETQKTKASQLLNQFQEVFGQQLITEILPFANFKPSEEKFVNYFYNNPEKPFCKTYINPKLQWLMNKFAKELDATRLDSIELVKSIS